MIKIDENLSIDESFISEEFIRASGPGGQNVNKVATAVKMKFHLLECPQIKEDLIEKIRKIAGKRINSKGELVIDARRFRTRERNRSDALARLISILRNARKEKKERKATKPGISSIEKRLKQKKIVAEKKKKREKNVDFSETY